MSTLVPAGRRLSSLRVRFVLFASFSWIGVSGVPGAIVVLEARTFVSLVTVA
jgi:hypothetical protein